MNTTGKVAAAVASGYLLGRTKKLRLAITVGGLLAGKRLNTSPRALVAQASEIIEKNPELARLSDQVRGKLMSAGREAAIAAASNRMNRVSDSIRTRTDRFLEPPLDDDDEYDEDEYDEDDSGDDSRSESRNGSRRSSRRGSRSAGAAHRPPPPTPGGRRAPYRGRDQTGVTPCRRQGRSTFLDSDSSSARMIVGRVSRGSITSSIMPLRAAT